MALSYGLTNPAAFIRQYEIYPDLFKFYTAVPTRSTESSAANKRRPVLFTSLTGGVRWNFESKTSTSTTHGFYDANYSGNFYFNASDVELRALAHKSVNSSYGAYKARAKESVDYRITVSNQSFAWSNVVAYNTANQPNREICKCPSTDRYFCIREGGGYAYNDGSWGTANWTTTSFNTSSTILNDDGGFKHICVDPEKSNDALVFFTTNDSNKYLRFYLCNLNDLSSPVNYTTTLFGATTRKQSEFRYVSIDYLPGVGYLIIYDYISNNDFCVKILRTYDPVTGEHLPYNQYIMPDALVHVGTSDSKMAAYGNHGWYCPWTKEYFFCPNAKQVWSTKDGLNWTQVGVDTSATANTGCVKFMTDGQTMVVATSGSAYYYSKDKGQTWWNDVTLSPNGFNTVRSNDSIVLPFKCTNNIGINTNNVDIGKYTNSSGVITSSDKNFMTLDYIPIDPNTNYIFYGVNKTDFIKSRFNRIDFYDSSYNLVGHREGYIVDVPSGQKEVPCIFTSPADAVYARVSCNLRDITVTQAGIDSYKWYFAKESDFHVMTEYGDIVCN